MNLKRVYVVIPAYNEQPRLPLVLKKLAKFIAPNRVVVVDDGSINPIKLKNDSWLLRHQLNLGKGAAMKTGADFAFSRGAEAVIFMDADGQHEPKEIPNFLSHLKKGFNVVFGSRKPSLNTPTLKLLGNKFSSFYISIFFGVYISDVPSGFRALDKKAYSLLKWDSYRYGVETEIVARLGMHRQKLKWIEFPIETIYMDKYKGFTIIEAIKILPETIWWKLS
ncbi:hypothetical protein A2397_05125 [Candidatus Amesbacteria bacterium RIFOXYB1_FULL_44_23]|uniref:Glycosyltransferase 2-like domain-containing protein n=1 Tax=Candidatus Amesbacteria bacterium RIFOXYB1_FULL_44_23 TaxID=1797263 RepID=A0A1F4ZR65_9BACT|nr:MAG: hypothetical protein A2397_05125 [Candidatus Amesbacteria bacterium RIFOXYB1_FULL_44_23]